MRSIHSIQAARTLRRLREQMFPCPKGLWQLPWVQDTMAAILAPLSHQGLRQHRIGLLATFRGPSSRVLLIKTKASVPSQWWSLNDGIPSQGNLAYCNQDCSSSRHSPLFSLRLLKIALTCFYAPGKCFHYFLATTFYCFMIALWVVFF